MAGQVGQRTRLRVLVVVGALVLAACGGGSSGSDADGAGPTTTAPDDVGVTTTTAPPERLDVVTSSWDEGTVTLADGAPSRFWGLVASPDGPGPYPVVLVLHGRHPVCSVDSDYGTWPCMEDSEIPNHEGLTYLAEALASRGLVAVVPGVNVQHTFGAGEPGPTVRTAELAQRTIDALLAGELGMPGDRADIDRLAVVGHSVGAGEAAVLATGATTFEPAVDGLVLLQPGLDDPRIRPLVDVPAVVVVNECDGDTGVSGAVVVAEALLDERERPVALVGLERSTHNATNSGLGPDPFPVVVGSPPCDDPGELEPEAQREVLAELVPELVLAVLDAGGAGWAGAVFDEPEHPAGVQLAVVPAGHRPATVPGDGPSSLDGLDLDGFTATSCPFGYFTPFVEPGTEACHRPELTFLAGWPKSVALSWDAPGASLTVPLEAPAGSVLRIRGYPDVADPRLGDGPLLLRLSDGGGWSHDVEWFVPPSLVEPTPDDPWDALVHAFIIWQTTTVELPVAVGSISVEVVAPEAGAFHLVSLSVDPD
jgi:dienelactone hydrolase